jgi:hypothetical protein
MFQMVSDWVKQGYYVSDEENALVQLGAGAAIHLLSEAALQMVQKSGIIVDKWNVVIETPDGSVMPPLPYAEQQDAVLAVKTALHPDSVSPLNVVSRIKTPDHEAFWYVPMAGTTYLILNREACIERMKIPQPSSRGLIM